MGKNKVIPRRCVNCPQGLWTEKFSKIDRILSCEIQENRLFKRFEKSLTNISTSGYSSICSINLHVIQVFSLFRTKQKPLRRGRSCFCLSGHSCQSQSFADSLGGLPLLSNSSWLHLIDEYIQFLSVCTCPALTNFTTLLLYSLP